MEQKRGSENLGSGAEVGLDVMQRDQHYGLIKGNLAKRTPTSLAILAVRLACSAGHDSPNSTLDRRITLIRRPVLEESFTYSYLLFIPSKKKKIYTAIIATMEMNYDEGVSSYQ